MNRPDLAEAAEQFLGLAGVEVPANDQALASRLRASAAIHLESMAAIGDRLHRYASDPVKRRGLVEPGGFLVDGIEFARAAESWRTAKPSA